MIDQVTPTTLTTTTLSRPSGFVRPLDAAEVEELRALPAQQQPEWGDEWLVGKARHDLTTLPGLVEWDEVRLLRHLLADVAAGQTLVVQAGDCAEDPAECVPEALTRKVGLLDALAGVMRVNAGKPVIRVGRIAGQFAKPRSRPVETVDGRELPVYRGHLVNGPGHDERVPDPLRLISCYEAARDAMGYLQRHRSGWVPPAEPPVWTSHEALVLDYELPLVRRDAEGRPLLTSTHWPWIGDRTRQLDGAHVELLSRVSNPVACKVGPSMTVAELVELCARLDPEREPGRLTLIARMGADKVGALLPGFVEAVRAEGHPVIWMSDPVHGNTMTAPSGHKTRLVTAMAREVTEFQLAVRAGGGVAGGLHLETTPDWVTECADDEASLGLVPTNYTTLCDPRMNPRQAFDIARLWR